MKIRINRKLAGNIMIGVLIVTAAVGVVMVAYLQLGQSSQKLTDRSQTWNLALPVAEAGLEEALTHLNSSKDGNLACNGWTGNGTTTTLPGNKGKGKGSGKATVVVVSSTVYERSRTLSTNAYYEVGIYFKGTKHRTNVVTIDSTGYVRDALTGNYISRTITGNVGMTNYIFSKAIIAKNHIRLGKGPLVDSFDSLNATYSTSGDYDAKKRKNNAGIATVNDKKNAIKIEDTKVYGDASTSNDGKGNNGDVEFKGKGTLGDITWVDGGKTGAQAGKITHNYQYDFIPVSPPWTGGGVPPTGGKVGKVNYQYILSTGNWQLGKVDLKEPMIVTGDAVLYVTGDLKANEDIIINSGASLRLYMGGKKFEGKDKGITLNGGDATQMHYDEAITKRPTDLDIYVLNSWTE